MLPGLGRSRGTGCEAREIDDDAGGPAAIVPLGAFGIRSLVEAEEAQAGADDLHREHIELAAFGPTDLLDRLSNERAWQTTRVIGAEDLLVLDGGPDSPAETDAAITEFQAQMDEDARIEAAYRTATDELAELEHIRADADAAMAAGRATIDNLDLADDLGERYDEVVDAVHGAGLVMALSMDDPDLRHGAEHINAAGLVARAEVDLTRALLLAGVGSPTSSDALTTASEIATVVATIGRWELGVTELERAREPYASVVDEYLPWVKESPVVAEAEKAVETGEIDVSALVDGMPTGEPRAAIQMQTAFGERLAEITAARRDDAHSQSTRLRALGLAALAGAAGLAMAAVLLAVMSGRQRRPIPEGWPPGAHPPPPPPQPPAGTDPPPQDATRGPKPPA